MERYYKRKLELPSSPERNDDRRKLSRQEINIFSKLLSQTGSENRILLEALIDCARFLCKQGLVFRVVNDYDDLNQGFVFLFFDENDDSINQHCFFDLLKLKAEYNDDIKSAMLKYEPENLEQLAPKIQEVIMSAAAIEAMNYILRDIGDALFAIMVYQSSDREREAHIAVVLRYVDKNGCVIERFVGFSQVIGNITAISLKAAIDRLFSGYGLKLSRLRGQGYNGICDMHEEFNDLQKLIMKENECAFYVHCFAYQLQLTLVEEAKNHLDICLLFIRAASLVNVLKGPHKSNILQEKPTTETIEVFANGEHSHYDTFICLIAMFSPVLDVLEIIEDGGANTDQKCEATKLLESIPMFDFSLCLHMMRTILGITEELSEALQRKDQDIVNAMDLVRVCKLRLQMLRNNGWDSLLDEVFAFCQKNDIDVPRMDEIYTECRKWKKSQPVTNLHHYPEELFIAVIDLILKELNNRFTTANIELLSCVACLCPQDSFSSFDKQKLVHLAEYYPKEFSALELMALDNQLDAFILDVRSSKEFSGLKGISDLAKRMVETKKSEVYPLVYLLVTLALILPIVTADVERAFSDMDIVKNRLKNQAGDQWMNDCLLLYIEREIFAGVDNAVIAKRLLHIPRKGKL